MGKNMGVRGRPGLLFVAILIIFLVVFFLTWKSMITPKTKSEVKDIYSMNFQSSRQSSHIDAHPHADFNDMWHQAKLIHGEKNDKQEKGLDNGSNLKSSNKINHGLPSEKSNVINSPLSNLLHATPQSTLKDKDTESYYKKPDASLKIIGGRMERLVHLDLKGAAPKVSYLKEIFPLFSRLGATGILMEYEDMFPYSGKLQIISAENSYTKEQIEEILGLAKLNSLQIIPLIQTFGHMEFILKALQMESLRESNFTPQVINVASNASYALIQEMVSQILTAHPTISYLHVGCDEVYELGKGKSADIIIKEKLSSEALFMRHVKRVADIVTKTSQKRVRPIIWDDELRKMPEYQIVAAELPSSVDIMVWRYTQNITDKLTETVWKKYGRLFKTVWAASSFKGATGARQLYTEPQHHIINHFSWMDAVSKYGNSVSFKGIALTGWQRFDHFATLCELLPVAIPSLAVCLATIKNGGFDKDTHKVTSSLLGCSGMIEMGFPKLDEKERRAVVTQDCRFPGHMIYYAVQELWGYKQFDEQGRRTGWLSDYQIRRGFSNPGQLNVLSMRLYSLLSSLTRVRSPLEENLLKVFTEDTVQEWLDENIFEEERQIKGILEKVKVMMKRNHWARRPNLPLITDSPDTKMNTKLSSMIDKVSGSQKRDFVARAQMPSGEKVKSFVANSNADGDSPRVNQIGQRQGTLNDGQNVAVIANKIAQRIDDHAQTINSPVFHDMTKNVDTGDLIKGKQGVLNKNSQVERSKTSLLDTLKNGHAFEGHRQSLQEQNPDHRFDQRLKDQQIVDLNADNKRNVDQSKGIQNSHRNMNDARSLDPLRMGIKIQGNVGKQRDQYMNVHQQLPIAKNAGGLAHPILNDNAGLDRHNNDEAMERSF